MLIGTRHACALRLLTVPRQRRSFCNLTAPTSGKLLRAGFPALLSTKTPKLNGGRIFDALWERFSCIADR